MQKDIKYNIATIFGLGNLPFAPGTYGSLVGLGLFLLVQGNMILYASLFIVLFIAGVITSNDVEKKSGINDPSFVIIDEVAGIFLTYAFVPVTLPVVIIGFALFRLFDITKIPPMRSLEKIGGGWGIMLDDIAAGIYANIVLQILVRTIL